MTFQFPLSKIDSSEHLAKCLETFWKAFWPPRAGLDWTGERKLVDPEKAPRWEASIQNAWRESSAKRWHPFLLIISIMFKSRIVLFLSKTYMATIWSSIAEIGAVRVKNCSLQFQVQKSGWENFESGKELCHMSRHIWDLGSYAFKSSCTW